MCHKYALHGETKSARKHIMNHFNSLLDVSLELLQNFISSSEDDLFYFMRLIEFAYLLCLSNAWSYKCCITNIFLANCWPRARPTSMTLRPQSASVHIGWFWMKCNRLDAADMVQIVTLVIGDSSMQYHRAFSWIVDRATWVTLVFCRMVIQILFEKRLIGCVIRGLIHSVCIKWLNWSSVATLFFWRNDRVSN